MIEIIRLADTARVQKEEMSRIRSKKDPNRKGAFIKPEPVKQEPEEDIKQITIPESLTIRELADKMKMPAAALVKKLFMQGQMVSLNQEITFDEAEEIALSFDIIAELEEKSRYGSRTSERGRRGRKQDEKTSTGCLRNGSR